MLISYYRARLKRQSSIMGVFTGISLPSNIVKAHTYIVKVLFVPFNDGGFHEREAEAEAAATRRNIDTACVLHSGPLQDRAALLVSRGVQQQLLPSRLYVLHV